MIKDMFDNKVSVDKLSAYLDGTLSEQETAEMDALVDSDKELQAVVDEYLSMQFELHNSKVPKQDDKAINMVAISAIQEAMDKVSEINQQVAASSVNSARAASGERNGRQKLRIMLGAACVIAAVVGGIVLLTPPSIQMNGDMAMPMSRDAGVVFGDEVDYESELAELDSIIEQKEDSLPSVTFFDRFKSEEKRMDLNKKRSEVYELQWRKICLLLQQGQQEALLRDELEEFVEIDGYHRERARELLEELNEPL